MGNDASTVSPSQTYCTAGVVTPRRITCADFPNLPCVSLLIGNLLGGLRSAAHQPCCFLNPMCVTQILNPSLLMGLQVASRRDASHVWGTAWEGP